MLDFVLALKSFQSIWEKNINTFGNHELHKVNNVKWKRPKMQATLREGAGHLRRNNAGDTIGGH